MTRAKVLTLLLLILTAAGGFVLWRSVGSLPAPEAITEADAGTGEAAGPAAEVHTLDIHDQDTYGALMDGAGVSSQDAQEIFAAAASVYDLSRIRSGKRLVLSFRPATGKLEKFTYDIDTEETLTVERNDGEQWIARREAIAYEVRVKTARGTIENFLYADALARGIDERAVIAWAEMFQWSIDFAMDVRTGDSYAFMYEERYLDGAYVMPGRVLAGKFVNDGRPYYGFYYEHPDGTYGYYDEAGNSLQKMFLKAPVAFKYISSGFTTGARYIQAFNISTGHRAIDYAAEYGTPIRATADGTVILAGWDGSYGNKVSVRHNGTYTTNYGHMSKIAVTRGQKVSQGDTIGYVGSTGLSTGPHVHYEMVKNGVKINPLTEVLPPGEPLPAGEKEAFLQSAADFRAKLDAE